MDFSILKIQGSRLQLVDARVVLPHFSVVSVSSVVNPSLVRLKTNH